MDSTKTILYKKQTFGFVAQEPGQNRNTKQPRTDCIPPRRGQSKRLKEQLTALQSERLQVVKEWNTGD